MNRWWLHDNVGGVKNVIGLLVNTNMAVDTKLTKTIQERKVYRALKRLNLPQGKDPIMNCYIPPPQGRMKSHVELVDTNLDIV